MDTPGVLPSMLTMTPLGTLSQGYRCTRVLSLPGCGLPAGRGCVSLVVSDPEPRVMPGP